jgi:hypothetical protein
MATTTPNFGWPVPTSTDLVKNGATAIEALGDAIDASMVDLEGGTTGQVLAKASNTDMDFAWVTTDDANAIQNAIVNAKGDIIGASANDVPAITSVGANGETLLADSAAATGLRYQSAYNANAIINGGFDIAQRGTSINTAATTFAYTLDRLWVYSNGPSVTTSQQATGDTTNLPNIQFAARCQRQSAQTATLSTVWNLPLETKNSIRFAGQTVTLSFFARKSATYTAAFGVNLYSGTGTDQSGLGGLTGQATVATSSPAITTTWTRFQLTGTVGATATQISVQFDSGTWVGTAGASDYFEITGVQLELGSIATTFKRAGGGLIQQELAACQRYFYKTFAQATTPAQNAGTTGCIQVPQVVIGAANQSVTSVRFPVTMRAAPTITIFNPSAANAQFRNGNGANDWSASATEQIGDSGVSFQGTGNASSNPGNRCQLHITAESEL